jgi:hypothetical protein
MAAFLSYFWLPFVDSTQSLTDQVESLSTFAHLAAILQLDSGSSCISSEVYADTQAAIKNIIFTIAQAQIIDPDI